MGTQKTAKRAGVIVPALALPAGVLSAPAWGIDGGAFSSHVQGAVQIFHDNDLVL